MYLLLILLRMFSAKCDEFGISVKLRKWKIQISKIRKIKKKVKNGILQIEEMMNTADIY